MAVGTQRQGMWQTTFAYDHGGWSTYEMFGGETGELAPRAVLHDGRVFVLYANRVAHELQVLAHTPGAVGWENLGPLTGIHTKRPPAPVSHGGELHAFLLETDGPRVRYATYGADGTWTVRDLRTDSGEGMTTGVMPGVVSHGGELHITTYSTGPGADRGIKHSVVKDGQASHPFTFPADAEPDSRLALVSYEDALHLIYTSEDRLNHWIRPDGGTWSQAPAPAQAPDGPSAGSAARFAVCAAVFDGKIYAAYQMDEVTRRPVDEEWDELLLGVYGTSPLYKEDSKPDRPVSARELRAAVAAGDTEYLASVTAAAVTTKRRTSRDLRGSLRKRTLLALMRGEEVPATIETTTPRIGYQVYDGTSWSAEAVLPAHANQPPSLVAFREPGEPDDGPGRLMLVYAGEDAWTPPPPPPPTPLGPEVAARRVRRDGMVTQGHDGHSGLDYSLEARVFHNPERNAYHVTAIWTFAAWARDGSGTPRRDGGHVSGRITLTQATPPHARVAEHAFTRETDGGSGTIELTWEIPPGEYDLTLADARTSGGHHFPHSLHAEVRPAPETLRVRVGD